MMKYYFCLYIVLLSCLVYSVFIIKQNNNIEIKNNKIKILLHCV